MFPKLEKSHFKIANLEIWRFSSSTYEFSFGFRTKSFQAKGLIFCKQTLNLCLNPISHGLLKSAETQCKGSILLFDLEVLCMYSGIQIDFTLEKKLGLNLKKLVRFYLDLTHENGRNLLKFRDTGLNFWIWSYFYVCDDSYLAT